MTSPIEKSQPSFIPVDAQLFFTRNDPQDPRLGDAAKALPRFSSSEDLFDTLTEKPLSGKDAVIAGYPDDDGIGANGGRRGAALAPDEIRRPLYKMTPDLFATGPMTNIWDLGNLNCATRADLSARHDVAESYAAACLRAGASWIGLGGGHDYGYPDGAAFAQWCRGEKLRPLVINFDAHLDVRSADKGITSGTPFYRLLEAFPETDLLEVGIQSQCNSRHHLDWFRQRGGRILSQDELRISGETMVTAVLRVLGEWIQRPRPVFISVDIDGFASSLAPGCSQSWATGFGALEFFQTFDVLLERLNLKVLGIYEVSPPLDQDNRTAKLAAQIVHRALSTRSDAASEKMR